MNKYIDAAGHTTIDCVVSSLISSDSSLITRSTTMIIVHVYIS